ncbi:MAG TPA: hypothetical protein VMN57_09630 [Anaerolineales bacterium]|nr:hypothetical protein [Anaerolineales bacterium]
METRNQALTRREFLRLCGLHAAGVLLPAGLLDRNRRPSKQEQHRLPEFLSAVLAAMPDLTLNAGGSLLIRDPLSDFEQPVPLAVTQWNREHNHPYDRLEPGKRWGIVLHWFGDEGPTDMPLDAYLRGFDAMRPVFNYETRTSTHFLIGASDPAQLDDPSAGIGIVQTQAPDVDGTPFLGSHLQALDYAGHLDRQQYFVRAFYKLAGEGFQVDSLLQEFFDSPVVIDPNLRTIAIDMTGHDFDEPGQLPGVQKIANLIALTWALMIRYRIRATDILGHHEIQLGKSDPGKRFMALVRLLIGLKAHLDGSPADRSLVFDGFGAAGEPAERIVARYLHFVRRHLALIGTPREVYAWEETCAFWNIDFIAVEASGTDPYPAPVFLPPISLDRASTSPGLAQPQNHEGIDLLTRGSSIAVRSIAAGTCIFTGAVADPHWGKMVMFRHHRSDGTELVSIYGHLDEIGRVEPGRAYRDPVTVGTLIRTAPYQDPYLHFALAFGAAWNESLRVHPAPPANAGEGWIRERYLDPVQLLQEWSSPDPRKIRKAG